MQKWKAKTCVNLYGRFPWFIPSSPSGPEISKDRWPKLCQKVRWFQHNNHVMNCFQCSNLYNNKLKTIKARKERIRAFSSYFLKFIYFIYFKKSFFYFNYPLLLSTSHPILYFTIYHIKIISQFLFKKKKKILKKNQNPESDASMTKSQTNHHQSQLDPHRRQNQTLH